MQKGTDFSEDKLIDLRDGAKATREVLERANAAIDQVRRKQELDDLIASVDDWKGHKLEHFGELVICGAHTVLKGEGQKEVERDVSGECVHYCNCCWSSLLTLLQYKVFLFERILLCCKEMNPNKPKNRLVSSRSIDKKGKPRLQLKGRIFMQNVTDVVRFEGKSGRCP